jgi:predicted DNA-binding transcriptional regulator YafY
MAAENSLVRQWILLRTLSARRQGVTVREIAAELGVCNKTIRRDLVAFAKAGFPLHETVEKGRCKQ